MKEIFWTIIVIWLIYQLMAIFKNIGTKNNFASFQQGTPDNTKSNTTVVKKDVKTAIKKHADKGGEYIDYEEVN